MNKDNDILARFDAKFAQYLTSDMLEYGLNRRQCFGVKSFLLKEIERAREEGSKSWPVSADALIDRGITAERERILALIEGRRVKGAMYNRSQEFYRPLNRLLTDLKAAINNPNAQ